MKKEPVTVKSWGEIQSEFDAMERMRCVPEGLRKVRADFIFDEEKPVRWNREQAAANNQRYQQEVARLNTEKNKRRDAIHEDIYTAIQAWVGHGLSRKKAKAIWSYAYQQGHSFGIREIMNHLDDAMELAEILLEKDEQSEGSK